MFVPTRAFTLLWYVASRDASRGSTNSAVTSIHACAVVSVSLPCRKLISC